MNSATLNLVLYNRNFVKILLLLALLSFSLLSAPQSAQAQTQMPESVSAAQITAPSADASGGFLAKLGDLAKKLVNSIIGIGGFILVISLVMAGFSGQIASALGMPYAQASAGQRTITAIGLFALTASAMFLGNLVIDQVGALLSGEGGGSIHIAGQQ